MAEEPPAKRAKLGELASHQVKLNYQEYPPPGKRTGRYIDQPDKGDAIDEHKPAEVSMHNARMREPSATLESVGFELKQWPTKVQDFRDDKEVESIYYEELRNLVKEATGADRVLIFDHTVRNTKNKNLNTAAGGTAAAVVRVHADYTAESAPARLKQLGKAGVYSHIRKRNMTEEEVAELMTKRFSFINVWRNIVETPVEVSPLAVADAISTPEADRFLYELIFPNRIGLNYSLKHSDKHKWFYYPKMVKDECLLFKTYDKKEDGPRFTFHTAFEDPLTPDDAPARQSIEARTIAFFDCPVPASSADDGCLVADAQKNLDENEFKE
jgi:hypothetical protein